MSIVGMNMSLMLNTVGFYQVGAKALCRGGGGVTGRMQRRGCAVTRL